VTDILDILNIAPDFPSDEPDYDSPQKSEWILGLDMDGSVFVVVAPNIHHDFFECGMDAELIGLPDVIEDKDPGLYKAICSLHESGGGSYYGGYADYDYSFEIDELTPVKVYGVDNAESD
jgi:hypothetical protein